MYTILLNNDNTLTTSIKERIMQRSKLVDSLHFLVEPLYKDDVEMKDFDVLMEYVLPVSKEYHTEILTLTSEGKVDEETGETVKEPILYKEKLEYKVPFDTALTKEAGDIEVTLTFTKTELDVDGNATQYVRKTSSTTITIVPVSKWCDIIPDSALSAIDQRILKVNEQIKAMSDLGELTVGTKADNITIDENRENIQLTSNGEKIGTAINIKDLADAITDNSPDIVKVIEF